MIDGRNAARGERELIERCLRGDPGARDEFQQQFGDLIYNYPMRVYRIPAEDAGDFYVFAFERGRIFRRTQTFEGRTSLRSYLSGYVLDNLVLEWKRGQRELETVSIEALSELPAGDTDAPAPSADQPSLTEILARLELSKAVLLKLLYIEDCDLGAADLRCLSHVSRRRLPDLLAGIDRLRSRVREREMGLQRTEDAAHTVHAWIQLYERRIRQIGDSLANLPPASTAAGRLRAECAELERKLQRRHRQRAALLARAQRRKVTTPYKEIAALLNTTVGTVASQILRARRELAARVRLSDDRSALGDSDD